MSLIFQLIPVSQAYENNANELITNILNKVKNQLDFFIDSQYSVPLRIRVKKFTDNNIDVIIINEEYEKTKYFLVQLSDIESEPELMNVEELIDLIESYDECPIKEDNKNTDETSGYDSDDSNNTGSGCFIC